MSGWLVVFGGLPGTGKTAVSRAVADGLDAVWLRVDAVELALRRADVDAATTPVGYAVAQALATDQLRLGHTVVIDAVNPVRAARAGWERCAKDSDAPLRFIEVRCPDVDEHRGRVQSRRPDLDGRVLPTWREVCDLEYEAWSEQRLVVDNDGTVAQSARKALSWLERGGLRPR